MEPTKKKDARVLATKRMLRDALLSILDEKPIGRVTVTELCGRAGISRGTFYLHYDTPEDLLHDIESSFLSTNMVAFEAFLGKGYEQDYLAGLFEDMLENRRLLRMLLGPNGDPSFMKGIIETVRDRTIDEWNIEFPQYRREDLDYLFDFVFPGISSLLLAWIENPRGVSAREFTFRVERLGHYALLAVSEFGQDGRTGSK